MRISLLLMPIMKSVDYEIDLDCIEDTQCRLKTIIPVLKGFIAHTKDFLCSNYHYNNCDQWENT